uniref:Uncharacterized protein n=1 Tax=Tanacetum cinerariifolium TaxID=118510 RepID=A0A699HX31_TANCI|nr:hypothetical protein [Tanacetum cinerariifolium]
MGLAIFSHGSFLWMRFMKAIYGEECALNSPSSLSKRSHWLDIIREQPLATVADNSSKKETATVDPSKKPKRLLSEFVGKGFVDNYPNFQEDENNVSFLGVVLGVEEESMQVYDTDIEDVIEEEEGFVGKREIPTWLSLM